MPEWIPTEKSAKGRLVLRALEVFSAQPYADVNVVQLCAAAEVTTGTLYHHFGTKEGLYEVVRLEVERRTLDRIEGALAARSADPRSEAARAALLVGFDYVISTGRARLVGAPVPADREDPIETALAAALGSDRNAARLWLAAWRAALLDAIGDPGADGIRDALARFTLADSG